MPYYQVAYEIVNPTQTLVTVILNGDATPGGYSIAPGGPYEVADQASDPSLWSAYDQADGFHRVVRDALRAEYRAQVTANAELAWNYVGNFLNMENVKITVNHQTAAPVVAPASVSQLHTAGNVTLTATTTPANATNRNMIWSSSNPAVATITPNEPANTAVLTPIAAGSCVITCIADDQAGNPNPNVPLQTTVAVTLT